MTLDQVRAFATSLPETVEAPHFDRTSFRIRRKIFATVLPDGEYLHIFVSDETREIALATVRDFLEELRWGTRVSGVRVVLASARRTIVEQLLLHAWSRKAPKKLVDAFATSR